MLKTEWNLIQRVIIRVIYKNFTVSLTTYRGCTLQLHPKTLS